MQSASQFSITNLVNAHSSNRKTAKAIGWSIMIMALLAGLCMPFLGSFWSAVGMIGILFLDLKVSCAILQYHRSQSAFLSWSSGILRFVYSGFLAFSIPFLFLNNVEAFQYWWGIGLIVFGLHLMTLGMVFNAEGKKKWITLIIKLLLVIAGFGYSFLYIGILLVDEPESFKTQVESIFMLPMIVGELSYAFWMLLKGGIEA